MSNTTQNPSTPWSVRIENVGKQYRRGGVRGLNDNFREEIMGAFAKILGRNRAPRESGLFWALRDVSLEFHRGETIGIVGRNGAGKSTLLKVLSRITPPTEGAMRYRGRLASLLEVGTGFHRELTGRENIFLNGTILGMRRAEIQRQFDAIVDFAGVEQFLDTPVKFYSSGMYVRLAFAVAAHLRTEILVIDEVLAVGDAAFQKKCLGKMEDVAHDGRTVLFVSHNMAAVRKLCSRSILLESGRLKMDGATDAVIAQYLDDSSAEMSSELALPMAAPEIPATGLRLRFLQTDGTPQAQFRLWEPWKIQLEFEVRKPLPQVIGAVGMRTADSVPLVTYWSKPKDLGAGKYAVEFLCDIPLKANDLRFVVGISSEEYTFYYVQDIGRVSISEVALDAQPFRASGSGLLLSHQTSEILPFDSPQE